MGAFQVFRCRLRCSAVVLTPPNNKKVSVGRCFLSGILNERTGASLTFPAFLSSLPANITPYFYPLCSVRRAGLSHSSAHLQGQRVNRWKISFSSWESFKWNREGERWERRSTVRTGEFYQQVLFLGICWWIQNLNCCLQEQKNVSFF